MFKMLVTMLPRTNLSSSELPHFIKKPSPLEVGLVGSDLELECQAGGDPAPVIHWRRSHHKTDLTGHNVKYLETGGVVLMNLHPSDEGEYECRAENKIGSVVSKVMIIVEEKPVITVAPENSVQVNT